MSTFKIKNITFGENNLNICAPFTGVNLEEIIEECNLALKLSPDLIEWRADFFSNINENTAIETLTKIKELIKKPIIFTLRIKQEGGENFLENTTRLSIISAIIKNNLADFIDIELINDDNFIATVKQLCNRNDTKLIISNHDFNCTPSLELIKKTLANMLEKEADITKIAYTPNDETDTLNILEATSWFSTLNPDKNIIAIAMNEKGLLTRFFGHQFGSILTFGILKTSTAKGQISISKLQEFRKIIQ